MADVSSASPPVMLDVDTGVDDALAIALAISLKMNLIGISTVAGNVNIDLATLNTRKVISWLGANSIPVHRGSSRPLAVARQNATHVHGENGMGGAEFPDPVARESRINGVQAILVNADLYRDELVLVALGPLTNLAMALAIRPHLAQQVGKLVVMSGAFFTAGNVTSHAEFNAYADPHAADQVMSASWNDLTAIGLDVTHSAVLTKGQWEAIEDGAARQADLIRRITARTFTARARDGIYIHDALAVAAAFQPSLVGTQTVKVEVSTATEQQGKTFVRDDASGRVQVATTLDVEAFEKLFAEQMSVPHRDERVTQERMD